MFRSASGSAASEEAVENAMSHGSFAAAPNRRTAPSHERDRKQDEHREGEQRPVEREHENAEVREHAEPAPAHRHRDRGADADRCELHHDRDDRNITSLRLSQNDSMSVFARPGDL